MGPICPGKEHPLGNRGLEWIGAHGSEHRPTWSMASPELQEQVPLLGPATRNSRDQGLFCQWSLLQSEAERRTGWAQGPSHWVPTSNLVVMEKWLCSKKTSGEGMEKTDCQGSRPPGTTLRTHLFTWWRSRYQAGMWADITVYH